MVRRAPWLRERSSRAARTVAGAVLVSLLVQVYLWWRPNADRAGDVILTAGGAVAVIAMGRRARRAPPGRRRTWIWSTVTAALWMVAYAQYAVHGLAGLRIPGAPAPANTAVLAAGTTVLVTVLIAPRAVFAAADRVRLLLDAVMICVALFGAAWVLLVGDLYRTSGEDEFGPLALLFAAEAVLVLSVVLLALASGHLGADIRAMLGGSAAAALSTVVLLGLALRDSPLAANGVDGGLLLASLLFAAGGQFPDRPVPARPPSAAPAAPSGRAWNRLGAVLPYLPLVLAMVVGAWTQYRDHRMPVVLVVTGAVVIAALLVRQYLALRANAALAAELQDRAVHDPLTGLGNRALLTESLARLDPPLPSTGHALLLVDLDGFKEVNDTLGHGAGDALLVAVAHRLQAQAGPHDLVVRLGGDEFAVLTTTATDDEALTMARATARRILDALDEPCPVAQRLVRVGASIGIAVAGAAGPDTGTPAEPAHGTLLRHADLAMYAAKRGGKHRFVVFTPDLAEQARGDLAIRADLSGALPDGQFELYLQPIVRLADGGVDALEALIRWRHPRRGLLAPGEFLERTHEAGLLGDVERWVIHAACRAITTLVPCHAADGHRCAAGAGGGPPRVSVNLHPHHAAADWLVPTVAAALSAAGLTGDRLTIEITEQSMIVNPPMAVENLLALHALGARIAVDDFGAAHASLRYLTELPIDVVKIDRGLVTHDFGPAIVEAITGLAHRLGLTVVAEGVENPRQLRGLVDAGCDAAQGYLLGRPAPASSVAACGSTIPEAGARPPAAADPVRIGHRNH